MTFLYLLSFGSNLGHREQNLCRGFEGLQKKGDVTARSRILETSPLPSLHYDISDHSPYLNCVCQFVSELAPQELYQLIRLLEDEVGHSRTRRWAPRELDIDILFCAQGSLLTPFSEANPVLFQGCDGLRVPHASIWERPFFLQLIVDELGIPEHSLAVHRGLVSHHSVAAPT